MTNIRIPHPIPLPVRAHLVAAGRAACDAPNGYQRDAVHEKEAAQAEVRRITADIALRYGIDDGRAA